MSIFCLLIIILISLLFGADFYNKENPRLITENIKTDDFKEIDFTPDKFTFAFRIENGAGNLAVDASTYINLMFGYKRYVYNETEQDFDNEGYIINQVPCNETLVPDTKFNSGRNLTEWICLDFPKEGFKFGGSWTGKFVNYFNIFMWNNTNIEETDKYLKSDSFYVSMFYPTFYFLPNNLTHPQNIKYVNYYTQITAALAKNDRIFVKNYILDDDVGWIFKDVKSSSVLAFERRESEFELNDLKQNDLDTYYFYSLVMYFNSEYDKIYRSYMKIQELSALVGGFMKIIMFIAEMLIIPYNRFLMRFDLVNQYYRSDSNTSDIDDNINKMNKSNSVQMINSKPMTKNLKGEDIDLLNHKKIASKNDVIENNYVKESVPNSEQKMHPFNKKGFESKIKDSANLELTSSIKKIVHKTLTEKNKKHFKINYFQYLLNFLFKSKSLMVKEFSVADDILNRKFDIASYLELVKQFELIKQLNLNYYQNYSLSVIENLNISSQEEVDLAELTIFRKGRNELELKQNQNNSITKINEMIFYFKTRKLENTLNEVDCKILDSLPISFKKYVYE